MKRFVTTPSNWMQFEKNILAFSPSLNILPSYSNLASPNAYETQTILK